MAATGYVSGDPAKVDLDEVGQPGGPAGPLTGGGRVPLAQLPTNPADLGAAAIGHVHDYEASGTAGAAVAAHAAGTDPHGDRAAAAAGLSAHASAATSVHGITDTAALETTTGSTSKVTAHTAATDPHGDRAYSAATFLAKGGGSLTGALAVNAAAGTTPPLGLPDARDTGVNVVSSFAGGEDDGLPGQFDSTGRLNLYSYQRADVGSYGEVLRMFAMRKDAKQMQAWYFPSGGYNASRDPIGQWKPVVWAGAHWEANNHASNHKHWSVETPDSTGAIQTRFEVRWGDPDNDTAIAGLDKTLVMTNLADFVVRCSNGQVLRLSAPSGVEKAIEINHDYAGTTPYRRWKIRATSEAESGGNAGTNLQVVAYDDAGTLITQAAHIERKTGNIGLGSTAPSARLHVTRSTGQLVYLLAPTTAQSAVLVEGGDTTVKALQTQVTGDTQKRAQILTDGKIEWGSGAATADTNLYRSAADTLKTDDALHIGAALRHLGTQAGFYGAAPAAKPSITGTRDSNSAVASLLAALAGLGLVTDSTTAGVSLAPTYSTPLNSPFPTNSTTLQDVTGLALAVPTAGTYEFDFIAPWSGSVGTGGTTSTNPRWQLNGPTSSHLAYTIEIATANSTTYTFFRANMSTPAAPTTGAQTADSIYITRIRGRIIATAAGTLQPQVALATGTWTGTVTIAAGAYGRLQQAA